MIELSQVHKVAHGTTVLDVDTLRIADGCIVAVAGSPGSGVEVLRDLLIARDQPTAGTIDVNGISPSDRAAFGAAVGVLFAENALYRHRSPRSHLRFECRLRGLDHTRIESLLKEVGLSDRADVPAGQLAPTLQRRLALARAVVHDPKALLLFEPFRECDAATVDVLSRCLRSRARAGTSVLILAHAPQHLARLCDAIHILEHGHIVATEVPGEAASSPLPLRIPVKVDEEIMLVNPADILFATAREGRCWLRLPDRDLPTQFTLSEVEERLTNRGFFRAHRSYLVNLQHVTTVVPYTRSTYTLVLDDANETQIPLSRSAAAELRELLGY